MSDISTYIETMHKLDAQLYKLSELLARASEYNHSLSSYYTRDSMCNQLISKHMISFRPELFKLCSICKYFKSYQRLQNVNPIGVSYYTQKDINRSELEDKIEEGRQLKQSAIECKDLCIQLDTKCKELSMLINILEIMCNFKHTPHMSVDVDE